MPFAHDGRGNYWVVDCLTEREEESHIYYACHDAPVLVYRGTGLADFLDAMPAYDRDERDSPIWRVWDDAVWSVWENNPGLIAQPDGLRSSNPAIQAFTEQIEEHWHIVDLRSVAIGMGFSWGRYGMNTRLRRFGEERIFAYAPAEKKSWSSSFSS